MLGDEVKVWIGIGLTDSRKEIEKAKKELTFSSFRQRRTVLVGNSSFRGLQWQRRRQRKLGGRAKVFFVLPPLNLYYEVFSWGTYPSWWLPQKIPTLPSKAAHNRQIINDIHNAQESGGMCVITAHRIAEASPLIPLDLIYKWQGILSRQLTPASEYHTSIAELGEHQPWFIIRGTHLKQ